MKMIFSERAQNFSELAIVIAVVGLVFFGMETYIRRGMQAKVKSLTDKMVGTDQYEYASDVSGLSVLKSHTDTSSESQAQAVTSEDGARQTFRHDKVNVEVTSESTYDP